MGKKRVERGFATKAIFSGGKKRATRPAILTFLGDPTIISYI